jgi:DNA repair protein RadC
MNQITLPRERLRTLGPDALGLNELLAVVLQSGTRRESIFEISERIIEDFGNRSLAACRSVSEVMDHFGLGEAKAAQLVACVELGRRLHDGGAREFPLLLGPAQAARFLEPMGRQMREVFRCLYLDTTNRLVRDEVISLGSLNSSLVHPREVFHFAVQYSAASVLLAHNHPSGTLDPSPEDLALTRQLVEAGEIMGIPVLDHLIITTNGWYSLRENGQLPGRGLKPAMPLAAATQERNGACVDRFPRPSGRSGF